MNTRLRLTKCTAQLQPTQVNKPKINNLTCAAVRQRVSSRHAVITPEKVPVHPHCQDRRYERSLSATEISLERPLLRADMVR